MKRTISSRAQTFQLCLGEDLAIELQMFIKNSQEIMNFNNDNSINDGNLEDLFQDESYFYKNPVTGELQPVNNNNKKI